MNSWVQISFRLDDITATMHWKNFDQLRALFNKHALYPLLGIIPDNHYKALDIDLPQADFWNIMRQLKKQGWSIAQHGYQHLPLSQNGGILKLNQKSEFAGLSFTEQFKRIQAGQAVLKQENLETNIWMAPWGTYDEITLNALKKANFCYVTDGQSLRPYLKSSLKFIPCQMEKPRKVLFAFITVCIHPNSVSSQYIKNLDLFIKRNRQYCIHFSDALKIKPSNNFFNISSEKMMLLLRKFK